jgi:hypothetical protein
VVLLGLPFHVGLVGMDGLEDGERDLLVDLLEEGGLRFPEGAVQLSRCRPGLLLSPSIALLFQGLASDDGH